MELDEWYSCVSVPEDDTGGWQTRPHEQPGTQRGTQAA